MSLSKHTLTPASKSSFMPFPKITGKVNDFLVNLDRLKQSGKLKGSQVSMEGTVKLHGMHADIVYDLSQAAAPVTFQSRNRICDPSESQQGWPRNIAQHPEALSSLKAKILSHYRAKNPKDRIDINKPLIVAGEWIGPKVQPKVGVSHLSARFVILSIQINWSWLPNSDIIGLDETPSGIFNIMQVPTFQVTYNIANRSPSNPALHQMQRLADHVEAACPYAEHFGVVGAGEGIVWKPALDLAWGNAKYWLKMKGPISDPANHIDVTRSGCSARQSPHAGEAARAWITSRRAQQGFEYLEEMKYESRGQRERAFTKWMTADILAEERTEIEEMAANDLTFIKRLREQIYFQARDAFLKKPAISGLSDSSEPTSIASQEEVADTRKESTAEAGKELSNEDRFLAAMEQILKR